MRKEFSGRIITVKYFSKDTARTRSLSWCQRYGQALQRQNAVQLRSRCSVSCRFDRGQLGTAGSADGDYVDGQKARRTQAGAGNTDSNGSPAGAIPALVARLRVGRARLQPQVLSDGELTLRSTRRIHLWREADVLRMSRVVTKLARWNTSDSRQFWMSGAVLQRSLSAATHTNGYRALLCFLYGRSFNASGRT